MNSHSVIFTDEEMTTVTGQWQTSYFRELLRTNNVLGQLQLPTYRFLQVIASRRIETVCSYVKWSEESREQVEKQMEALGYNYAVVLDQEQRGLKTVVDVIRY